PLNVIPAAAGIQWMVSPRSRGRLSDEGWRRSRAEVEERLGLRGFGAVLRSALARACRLRHRGYVGPGHARHPRAGHALLARGARRFRAFLGELLGGVREIVQGRELLADHQDGGEPEADRDAAEHFHGPRMILPQW